MKNSSRFELKIARNLTRSKQRVRRVFGLFQHARVELQPAQFAVDEMLGLEGLFEHESQVGMRSEVRGRRRR